MFENSNIYAEMQNRANKGIVNTPTNETYWYTASQSYQKLNRTAVYIRHANPDLMATLVQDFDTDREAKDACTALNRARPYEYSIVESLIRQTHEHTETREVA